MQGGNNMEEVRNVFKRAKWDSIITSILAILVGVLCIAMPNESGDVLCTVFGVSLLVVCVSMFVRYFAYERLFGEHLLILSIVTLALGIFCLVYPNTIKGILTVLFGLFIVVDSASSLSDSVYCAKADIKGWLLLFLLSLLTIVLGVAVMFSTFDTVVVFAGCSLIVEGVRRLVVTLVFNKRIKEAKKSLKEMM